MATKKTSIFTLTERLTSIAGGVDTFATIDLGSYVDVGDRQAIECLSVLSHFGYGRWRRCC